MVDRPRRGAQLLSRERRSRPDLPLPTLLDQFVACRTTLHDLQQRIAALGQKLNISDIAAHLTGTTELPPMIHNVLADAINQRLLELAERACVLHRHSPD